MNRRTFLQFLGAIFFLIIRKSHAFNQQRNRVIDLTDSAILLPEYIIVEKSKQIFKFAVKSLTLSSANYQMVFSGAKTIELDPNQTPAVLLALNNGNTSRRYMLLKRFISYMLYEIDIHKVSAENYQRIRDKIEQFQHEEIINYISVSQIAELWIHFVSVQKIFDVTWNRDVGFKVIKSPR